MEKTHFQSSYQSNSKVRWLYNLAKVSRLVGVKELRREINEKVHRIERRKGGLDQDTADQIVENLLMAKINKRLLDFRIKTYVPSIRKDSPTQQLNPDLGSQGYTCEISACPIFKEKNYRLRNHPSILVPGFVPDGNEAFFLLRKVFLKYGSVYYLNYPSQNFNRTVMFHQLYDLIADINHRKFKNAGKKGAPFLVGTSFGCSMILSFYRWLQENGLRSNLDIQGVILISPVLCLEDVVDPNAARQKTLVGRAISHLFEADENDEEAIDKAMAKARNIFQKMFTSGRDMLNFTSKDLIPVFAIEDHVLSLFDKDIGRTSGFFRRYLELKNEAPLEETFLTSTPTLVLFAEGEEDVLAPNSPTLNVFSNIESLRKIFPNGSVEFVYSKNSDRKVTHSDLIFQAERFADHLDPWLDRFGQ